jgi:hypothetical protein
MKVSREDGQTIANRGDEYEPVLLKFSGSIQDRYMLHPEAVSLHNEDATVTLYDAEKVLERGTVNKHFQNTTLKDVIDFIVDRREDPNGVILGVKHPESGIGGAAVEDYGRLGQEGTVGDIANLLMEVVNIVVFPVVADTSLKLKDMNPFEALKKTADAFSLQTWVDQEGYLRYGFRGAKTNSLVIGENHPEIRLKEYNVSVGSGKLAQVILQGKYDYIINTPDRKVKDLARPNVYSYGKAWLVDEDGNAVEGQTYKPDKVVPTTTPKEVEHSARRELILHYMGRKNGNIVINAGASTDTETLTKLKVGDLVAAQASIREHCDRAVDTGIFTVQNVQHKLDKRRGWLTTVDVAALPASDIASESWIENPENGTRWESVEEYEYGG